jgi:hypothetical protein
MCGRILAVLLIVGWVIFSGFDLLEDLEVPGQVGVSSSVPSNESVPDSGFGGNLVNNIVESADRTPLPHVWLFTFAAVYLSLNALFVFKRLAAISSTASF